MEMKEKAPEVSHEKVMMAVTQFLGRRGFSVLARDVAYADLPGMADLVITDGEGVAAVSVDSATVPDEGDPQQVDFPKPATDLGDMRALLARWCSENGHEGSETRVDAISMHVIGGHRAFLRWHQNRLE